MKTTTEADEVRQWNLVSAGAAVCLTLGYLLPWVYIELAHGRVSYAGVDLPVLRWLSAAWIALLIAILFVDRLRRRRAIGIAAGVLSVLSGVATLTFLLAVHEFPHLMLRNLLPTAVRGYIPGVFIGPGLPVMAVGYFLTAFGVHSAFRTSTKREPAIFPIPAPSAHDDDDLWKESTW